MASISTIACATLTGLVGCAPPDSISLGDLDEICGLTDAQKWRVVAADREFLRARDAYKATIGERQARAKAAIDAARKRRDSKALARAMQDFRNVMAPIGEMGRTHYAELMAVLTDRQMALWRRHAAVTTMRSIFGPLKLTDAQIARIGELYDELIAREELTRKEMMTLLAVRIRAGVLDDRQRRRYAKATKPGPYGTKRL